MSACEYCGQEHPFLSAHLPVPKTKNPNAMEFDEVFKSNNSLPSCWECSKVRDELERVTAERDKMKRVVDAARVMCFSVGLVHTYHPEQELSDALAALDADGEGEK